MFKDLKIKGAKVYYPKIFYDNRGLFFENYNEQEFRQNGICTKFIQDNTSMSVKRNTIRGLHLQKGEYAQSKLVRCIKGEILDIIVDLRKDSETFLLWESIHLSDKNRDMVFIPKGCAHGFRTLVDNTEIHYKVDNFYNFDSERTLIYNDKNINIDWGIDLKKGKFIISNKDLRGVTLENLDF